MLEKKIGFYQEKSCLSIDEEAYSSKSSSEEIYPYVMNYIVSPSEMPLDWQYGSMETGTRVGSVTQKDD